MKRHRDRMLHATFVTDAATLRELAAGPRFEVLLEFPGGGRCAWIAGLDERIPVPAGCRVIAPVMKREPFVLDAASEIKVTVGAPRHEGTIRVNYPPGTSLADIPSS